MNIDVRKEKKDSFLNAIKTQMASVGPLNFSSKSIPAANLHLSDGISFRYT